MSVFFSSMLELWNRDEFCFRCLSFSNALVVVIDEIE